MHFHLLYCASALDHLPSIISEIVVLYVLIWILSGTEIWGPLTRQMRIGRIPPLFLDRTVCDWCYRCCLVYILLLQIEEEIASKEPGLAIVGIRRELTWISPYVFGREVGISIVDLIIRFRGNKKAGE
jgi:hypothetical protein